MTDSNSDETEPKCSTVTEEIAATHERLASLKCALSKLTPCGYRANTAVARANFRAARAHLDLAETSLALAIATVSAVSTYDEPDY